MIRAKCNPVDFWNGCLWQAKTIYTLAMQRPKTYGFQNAKNLVRRYGRVFDYINNRNYMAGKTEHIPLARLIAEKR